MMKKKRLRIALAVAVVATLYQAPAQALFGIGDLSFDPTSYGELVSLYDQAKQLYDTAEKQLNSLASIESTIKEANHAYDSIVNLNLKKIAGDLTPRNPNGSDNQFAAMSAELSRIQSTAGADSAYVQYQAQRLKNLESLTLLQGASADNTQRAADKTNQATSSQITAQSTSTLAALAASEEQRRIQEESALATSRKTEIDNVNDSKQLYDAIGMTPHTR